MIEHAGGAIAQGYLFGKPMPIEETVKVLSSSAVSLGSDRRTGGRHGAMSR